MRGHAASVGSVDILVRAVLEEFPELDAARVRAALERGVARNASASLDTEGYRVVDLHLARVEATEESSERADILRSLSETSRSAAMPTAHSLSGSARSPRRRPQTTSIRCSASRA